MSGPVLVWEHLAAGFVRAARRPRSRRERRLRRRRLPRAAPRCNRWTAASATRSASGPLLEIPVNCESYNLAYVPAVLERAGVDVPATWDEYFDAARAIVERRTARSAASHSAARTPGTRCTRASRRSSGRAAAPTSTTAAARSPRPTSVGSPRTSSPRCATPGPTDWPDQRWYELALDFAHGPLRADRRLRPLRRVLRGSGTSDARRADRLRARRRSARPASAGRTSGRGRS